MAQNKNVSLLVYWPIQQNDPDYYEYNYALDFCRDFLRNSLKNKGFSFIWCDYEVGRIGDSLMHPAEYILVIKDPLLLLSTYTLSMMMTLIDKDYYAVGPRFSKSNFQSQLANPLFTVFNSTTFEELSKYYNKTNKPVAEDVNELNTACILFSSGYISKAGSSAFFKNVSGNSFKSNGSRLGVLLNSYAYSFENTEGHERLDLAALIPQGVKSLLDIGCSQGGLGRTIRKLRPEIAIEGLEINASLANRAALVYNKIHRSSIEEFSPHKSYDCIICGDVLEHLFDPWKQLDRIFKLTNIGGCLIISVPNAGHWTLVSDLLQAKFEYLPWGITCISHLRWFTETSIRQAIENSGFRIELFNHEQIEPSLVGKRFITQMVGSGFGNEQSLLTNGFIIKAVK